MATGPLPAGYFGTGRLTLPKGNVWKNPAFRRLWLAGLVSQLGDRVHQIALLWWATETTRSPAIAGTLLMASTLPLVLVSPAAGWLADRWGRKPMMILADGLRLVVSAVIALLAWQGTLTVAWAFGFSLILAIGAALFNPASMAILPDLVDDDDLPQANSWQELMMQATGVAGPALGGVAIALMGAGVSFAFNAVTFALSALLLLGIRLKNHAVLTEEPFLQGMRSSWQFLKGRPDISWLLASFGALNFFGVPVLVYTPYFANEVFHTGSTGFGLMEAAVPLGMGIVALWVGKRGEPGSVGAVYPKSMGVQAVGYLLMGLWPSMPLFLVALTVIGGAIGLLNIVVISHFQRIVPGEQLGRFMGLLMTVAMGIVPVSFGLAGILTTQVSPSLVLVGCGVAIAGLSVAVRRIPGLSA